MPLGILYVFAKEPEPGRVKTRLCPPLRPAQAVDVAEAFLGDMLDSLAAAAGGRFELRLAVSPEAGGPRLAAVARRFTLACVAQGEGDLGRRMENVMAAGLEQAPVVALVGGDVPDLPVAYVRSAFEMLGASGDPPCVRERRREEATGACGAAPALQVVLGPSTDGGYYLVAARRRVEGLFCIDAPWGSADVLRATTARLREDGVPYALLPQWSDVDDAASLASLSRRLAGGAAARCPRSADVLARLRREGWRP